jgi:uncharacterized protein (TIGR02246 family)
MNRTAILVYCGALAACAPSSSPSLSDSQRTAIADSVKRHSEAWRLAAEHANADEVMAQYHNTPDAGFIRDQKVQTYDSIQAALRRDFTTTRSQSVEIKSQRIDVLSPDAAIESAAGNWASVDTSGTKGTGTFGLTRVWADRDGKWGIISSNLTVVVPPVVTTPARRR